MNRRQVLRRTAALSLAGLLAGCPGDGPDATESTDTEATQASGCTLSSSLGDAPAVEVRADGSHPNPEATLDLRWNARTQLSAAESDDAIVGYEADAGEAYVVFRLVVTNTADEVLTVDRANFELEYRTPEAVETVVPAVTGLETLDLSVGPGRTIDGVLLFSVPRAASTATLRPATPSEPDRVPLAFDPTCDDSLAVDLPLF